MLSHTKRVLTSFKVARMPGCDIEWSELKTARRKDLGTNGRGTPVVTSHAIVPSLVASGISFNCRTELPLCCK